MMLIAFDTDVAVDIADGPVPLTLVRRMAAEHKVWCIGARTLTNFVTMEWDQHPSKSAALYRWKENNPGMERYIVVDDMPVQYTEGWQGWEFMSPEQFLEEFGHLDPGPGP